MAPKKRSLRFSLLVTIGTTILCVLVLVVLVFRSLMTSGIRASEDTQMRELSGTLLGAIESIEASTQSEVRSWASSDETRNFALGTNNLVYFEQEMVNSSVFSSNRYDYMLVKDLAGKDLFAACCDLEYPEFPEGLSEVITRLGEQVLSEYMPASSGQLSIGKTGLLMHDDVPYLVSTMPILDNKERMKPAGTMSFVIRIDERYMRNLTRLDTARFRFSSIPAGTVLKGVEIQPVDDKTIELTEPMLDVFGNPIQLVMSHPRTIYEAGARLVWLTGLLLVALLLAVLLALYLVIERVFVTRIRILSQDVAELSEGDHLPEGRYGASREFTQLTGSVNEMLSRLEAGRLEREQSQMSLTVLGNILNSMDAFLYVSDPETDKILFINEKMKRHYGLPDDLEGEVCWKVLQSGFTERCSFCPMHQLDKDPDGVVNWEEHSTVTGRYYRNTDRLIDWTHGRKVHLQHSVDITEMKNAEAELIRLSAIVESSPQYISFLSKRGEAQYFNPGASKITGYTNQELIEGGLPLTFSDEEMHRILGELLPKVDELGQLTFELTMRCANGDTRLMRFSAFKVDEKAGGGYGGIAEDITETRKLELDLIKAKEQAEAAREQAEQSSLAKGEFLSRMSHEMRTPMNAIIGMTNIARSSDDPERKAYCLDKINDASKHLLGVINDILDMSKIEANKFELSCSDFGFERMLVNVVNVVNFRVDEKRQNLLLNIDKRIPEVILGDEQRLAQVMTNLLTNAVKFTPDEGTIELTAKLLNENSEDEDLELRIAVRDTGIGITTEQQGKLFRSFEQANGGISRKFGGTGLGLAISKRIVELMGGQIKVTSVYGEGSTFEFTCKLKRSHAELSESMGSKLHRKNLRVLAVDDLSDALMYIQHVMDQLGLSCDVALSGPEALQMLQKAEKPYDVIFIDWRMPIMNGVELTREIRKRNMGNPVIIMISVAEWTDIEEEAIEAGVSTFIPKPLFPSQVAQCINAYFDAESGDGQIDAVVEDENNFAGRTVLLAEDVEINREIVLALLEDTGIQIDCAENGAVAVRMFESDPNRYDLILMDIQMPEVDGLEATRQIRAMDSDKAKSVPIVAMTANAFREDVEKCLAAGMQSHIAKPIDLDVLFNTLHRFLK